MWRDLAAVVRHPGGALCLFAVPVGENRAPAAQDRCGFQRTPRGGKGRALKPRGQPWLAFGPRRRQRQAVAVGHGFKNRHGAVALFDGDAELNALHQALEALRVVALGGTDHAFGDDAAGFGQGQHDAAVQALDAEIDPVFRGEGIGNQLERVVHCASPLDWIVQSLTGCDRD